MAGESKSPILESMKGKQVDVTTAAGAHVVGTLKDTDGDFLLVISGGQQLLVPRYAIALITLALKKPPEMGVE